MRFTKSWHLGVVAALLSTLSMAQTRIDGTIEGTVLDSQGLAVPGATVTVSSPALIQAAVVTTGPEGRYRATQLPVGTYTVRVEMPGFKTRGLTGIELSVGRILVMNATLEPGGAAEAVTVVAETPVIDTQQVKNVQTITKEVIDNLPLSRDPVTGPSQLAPASSSARPRARGATRPTTFSTARTSRSPIRALLRPPSAGMPLRRSSSSPPRTRWRTTPPSGAR